MTLALVGAFERDNFGDLLFPLVTARLIGIESVTYLAAFDGTVDHLVGRDVHPHPAWFRGNPVDAIWVVGGEIGATTAKDAAAMVGEVPKGDLSDLESPYLPRPSRHFSTLGVPLIVNSAGLAFMNNLGAVDRLRVVQALREADAVSVRDEASSRWASSVGIDHTMAPDVVHAIRDVWKPTPPQGHVVVQLNTETLTPQQVPALVGQLVSSGAVKSDRQVKLVAAGLAPGHDDLGDLTQLAHAFKHAVPGCPVSVLHDRDPLVIADAVASAGLVVATSLHVRIVAATFDVPRVSLVNGKVTGYCETWDSTMPHNVTVNELADAVNSVDGQPRAEVGGKLAMHAMENVDTGKLALSGDTAARTAQRLDAVTRHLRDLEELASNPAEGIPTRMSAQKVVRAVARHARRALDSLYASRE